MLVANSRNSINPTETKLGQFDYTAACEHHQQCELKNCSGTRTIPELFEPAGDPTETVLVIARKLKLGNAGGLDATNAADQPESASKFKIR